jgi:hypothetical protein
MIQSIPIRRIRFGCCARARERPSGRRAAEQGGQLTSCHVMHGLPSGTRHASLPQREPAVEAFAGPWDRPELF